MDHAEEDHHVMEIQSYDDVEEEDDVQFKQLSEQMECEDSFDLYMKMHSVQSPTHEWKRVRTGRVTATGMSVVAGLSLYGTPGDFALKLLLYGSGGCYEEQEMTEIMRMGCLMEDTVLASFEYITGNTTHESPYRTNDMFPGVGATPDSFVKRDCLMEGEPPTLVEAKNAAYALYEAPPMMYVVQTMVQMHTYKVPYCYLTARCGQLCSIWRIYFNERFWAFLIMMYARFKICMDSDIYPDSRVIPNISHAAKEFADNLFKNRERIARKHNIEPHQLPPDVRIDVVCKEREVPPYLIRKVEADFLVCAANLVERRHAQRIK